MSRPGLEELKRAADTLPLRAMAVRVPLVEWDLPEESPVDDAGGCPAAVSVPKGQLSGLKKHLERSILLLLPPPISVGWEKRQFYFADFIFFFNLTGRVRQ